MVAIACPERYVVGLDISDRAINKAIEVRAFCMPVCRVCPSIKPDRQSAKALRYRRPQIFQDLLYSIKCYVFANSDWWALYFFYGLKALAYLGCTWTTKKINDFLDLYRYHMNSILSLNFFKVRRLSFAKK